MRRYDFSPRALTKIWSPPVRSDRYFSCWSTLESTLFVGVCGSGVAILTYLGCHFGERSGCSSSHRAKSSGSKLVPSLGYEGGHHLVAGEDVGNPVDRSEEDVGMAGDHRVDRTGGEVLAVDPQPVGGAAREVDPAVGIDVTEVAAPVPAAARRRSHGLFVLVVALERADTGGVDDLAHAHICVDEPAVGVELGDGHRLAVRVDDRHVVSQRSRSSRAAGLPTGRGRSPPRSIRRRRPLRGRNVGTPTPPPAGSLRSRRRGGAGCRRRRASRAWRADRRAACPCS